VQNGYPYGVISRYLAYDAEWKAMSAIVVGRKSFLFHAVPSTQDDGRQVYVLAVGESSSRRHWQLFGYDRPTNPELQKESGLVPIPDMLASWPESLAAIPQVLTRQPIADTNPLWHEASILRAMQEAGFDTWWISNQLPIGETDSLISILALEAAHTIFLNHATYDYPGSYDEALLRPLRDVLREKRGNLFIVLHMMGSHMSYDMRYPPPFAHFQPIDEDASSQVLRNRRILNSYDNTILYTDHVLSRVIEILRGSDAIAALFFESDHGEALPTSTCGRVGHGIGTRYEFEIPALFWYSDAYASAFPDRIAALRSNADKRTLSANTFESLIDMSGVTFPGHDESWSLFSPRWNYHARIVNPRHLSPVDYDIASFANKCEIPSPFEPAKEKTGQ